MPHPFLPLEGSSACDLSREPATSCPSHWDAFPINYAITPPMMGLATPPIVCLVDRPCDAPTSGTKHGFYYKEASVRRGYIPPIPPSTFRHPQPCTIIPTTTTTAMAHLIDGEPANFEAHFLYSDNPRHGFCVMSVKPLVHYEFRTPAGFLNTHTVVTDASGATVVTFNWFGPSALGTMTWPDPPEREAHMGDLVQPSPTVPE